MARKTAPYSPLNVIALGWAVSASLVALFVICLAVALALPQWPATHAWIGLFSVAPLTSGTAPGYGAFAGVEFKPTSNLSLSFGAGFTQQDSGRMDSDIRSNMLPGESPALGGLRR